MNIGIIGSGNIGANAARLFVKSGHQVAISNSRGPESLTALVEEVGPNLEAVTVEEAATFGEVVLVAIPFGLYQSLPLEALTGKIVIDSTNYYPQRDGQIELNGRASSELVAQYLSGSKVVKVFNTMWYRTLATEGKPEAPLEERLVLFIAGDDPQAKAVVSGLIEEIGFAPYDNGGLKDSKRQEPDTPIYAKSLTPAQAREILAASSD